MRLLKVELTRFVSRRAVLVIALLGALIVGAIAAGVLYNGRPVSDIERAAAVAEAERYNQDNWVQRQVERCEQQGNTTEWCEQRHGIDPEDLLYRPPLDLNQYGGWVIGMTAVLAALALLIGSTFVGADFSSGSIGTQLIFQPGRTRMWAAKAGSVLVGTGVYAVAVLGAANGAILGFAQAWDRPIRDGLLVDWTATLGRGLLVVLAAGLGGYAIALLSRHTAAALGVLAAYGIAGETVARLVWPGSERWLLSNHLIAWLDGTWRMVRYDTCLTGECQPEIIRFTTTGAGLYLGLLAASVLAASLVVFRRRDVA